MAMFLCYTPDSGNAGYTEEDMQRARQEGYAEGYSSGYESGQEAGEDGEIFEWGLASDTQIAMMVAAADHGVLDLTEFWAVGDERDVHLNAMSAMSPLDDVHEAQDVTLVLVAVDTGTANASNPCWHYQYVTATEGRTYPSFIVQQKNSLVNAGRLQSSQTASYSWTNCNRRTWCNTIYKNSIAGGADFYDDPNYHDCYTFIENFKYVIVKTGSGYDSSTLANTQDYFFLPTEKEVQGDKSYGLSIENNTFVQWQYYQTSSNRIKKRGNTGSANSWYLRSPVQSSSSYQSSNYFACYTTSNGYADCNSAALLYGLSIAGCI